MKTGGIRTVGLVTDNNKNGIKTGIPNTIYIERDDESSTKAKAVSASNVIPLPLGSDFQSPFKKGDLALLQAEDCCSTDGGETCDESLYFFCSVERRCENSICSGVWISSISPTFVPTVSHTLASTDTPTLNLTQIPDVYLWPGGSTSECPESTAVLLDDCFKAAFF